MSLISRTSICIACDAIIILKAIGVPRRHCDDCRELYVKAKQRAHNKVIKAMHQGRVKWASEFKCVDCDKPAQVWDHRDYRLPYEIVPTCKRCNALRGPAIWAGSKHKPDIRLPAISFASDAPDCAAFSLFECEDPRAHLSHLSRTLASRMSDDSQRRLDNFVGIVPRPHRQGGA